MTGDPTPEEAAVLREMAERCAGDPPTGSRWTREERVAVVFSVLCSMWRSSDKKR